MSDLGKYGKDNGIKFFLFNFTDLFGTQRAKLVPAEAASRMQKAGAGFAGFATWLDQTPAHPDILVMPDPNSIIPLPWRPEGAWASGSPFIHGSPPTHPTPRRHGRGIIQVRARLTRVSGCARVWASPGAKAAKPAPA